MKKEQPLGISSGGNLIDIIASRARIISPQRSEKLQTFRDRHYDSALPLRMKKRNKRNIIDFQRSPNSAPMSVSVFPPCNISPINYNHTPPFPINHAVPLLTLLTTSYAFPFLFWVPKQQVMLLSDNMIQRSFDNLF